MGKPFKMVLDDDQWIPRKTDNSTITPAAELETVKIHELTNNKTYLTVVGANKCYEVDADFFFLVFRKNPKPGDIEEWVPCSKNNINHEYPTTTCPSPGAVIAELKICEGSQWVNIGGRWYKIG